MYTSVNNNNLKYRLIICYEFDRVLVRHSIIIIVNIFENITISDILHLHFY